MKKIMLLTSFVAISLQGMDRFSQGSNGQYAGVTNWMPNSNQMESGLVLQTVASDLFNDVSYDAQAFGGQGSIIVPGSISIKFVPKENDKEGISILQRAQPAQGSKKLTHLFITCLPHSVSFDEKAQIIKTKHGGYIDLSTAINSIPHHVRFIDLRTKEYRQISAAGFVLSLLRKITTGDILGAAEQLSILKGQKAANLMFALRPVISEDQYRKLAAQEIEFLGGVKKVMSHLLKKAEKQAEQLQQEIHNQVALLKDQFKNEGTKAANSFIQTFKNNKLYSVVCLGLGGAFVYLLTWWKNK